MHYIVNLIETIKEFNYSSTNHSLSVHKIIQIQTTEFANWDYCLIHNVADVKPKSILTNIELVLSLCVANGKQEKIDVFVCSTKMGCSVSNLILSAFWRRYPRKNDTIFAYHATRADHCSFHFPSKQSLITSHFVPRLFIRSFINEVERIFCDTKFFMEGSSKLGFLCFRKKFMTLYPEMVKASPGCCELSIQNNFH